MTDRVKVTAANERAASVTISSILHVEVLTIKINILSVIVRLAYNIIIQVNCKLGRNIGFWAVGVQTTTLCLT